MLIAGCGGGDDGGTTALQGTDGGKQTGNGQNQNGNAPAVDISVPPVELPDTVQPVNYRLWFRPDAALNGFSGRADIDIKVTKPVPAIVLGARNLKFANGRAILQPGNRKLIPVPQTGGDFYEFRLPSGEIAPGNYVLHLEWTGTINFTAAEGIFKLGLQGSDGASTDAIVTQGESNLARQWFPAWDEPAFRHTFEITAEVPGNWVTVSNGSQKSSTKLPDGYQQVAFNKTPSMPAYLVFFGGGKFDKLEDQFTSPLDGKVTKLRWLVPAGEAHSATLGMQFTKESLQYYHNYFGISLPFDKLDTVAANDSYDNKNAGFGGMENWAAIFEFADQVLVPPAGAPTSIKPRGKERSFVVVSHEVAHQWFGDLVTLDWWDNIWLNESFANWFENVTKIALHPDYKGNTWADYVGVKQRIFTLDLKDTALPILHNASDAGSNEVFDIFVYNKGGHVLQMIENYVGKDAMRKALQTYLKKYSFGHGTPPRLWTELEAASGKKVAYVGDSFVRQTGVPLVTVDPQCDYSANRSYVTLTQSAFPNQNIYPGSAWNIPITLAYGEGLAKRKTIVLDQASAQVTLDGCSAVVANPTGLDYYIANYSGAGWSSLLASAGSLADQAVKTNIAGDALQLLTAKLITQAQYDQIAAIKDFQPALQTLQAQALEAAATGKLAPEPIHGGFKFKGAMKHLYELKQ